MLLMIIRKELLLNLVSFKFMVSIILLAVLVIGSLQMMATNYTRRLQDFSTGVEIHNNDLAGINTRLQFEAFGVTKDPRPAVLGIFSIGLEKQMSRSFMVPGYAMGNSEGHGSRVVYASSRLVGIMPEGSKYANPIFTLFMPPDFIYIVNIALSLLALLFAFDTISGEKEDQTLKLMLTNSVPRDIVLFGKWIGGTLSILLPFLISFGIGVLLVSIRRNVSFADEAPARILVILLASMVYISVFFLMGMLFSAFSSRSSTALILSLFAWVLFVLVIPNISPVIARQFIPLKTPDQIVRESERIEEDMRRDIWNSDRSEEEKREMWNRIKEEVPRRVRALEDRWLNALERQINLAVNISRISPSANYIYISSSIAGTGIEDYKKLRDEIFRYRRELGDKRKKFVKRDKSKPIPMLYIKIDAEKVPQFRDQRLPLDTSMNNILWDFLILFIYLALFFLVTFVRFLTYDVK